MKRREFIRIAAMAPVAAAALNPLNVVKAQDPPTRRPPQGMPPGGFPGRNQGPAVYEPTGPGIHVRFLGTGGADWNGPSDSGELRRHASILADGKVLFDFTPSSADMVPEKHPEVVFYTHSHNDHYDAKAALELGIKRVYLGQTWLERAKSDFQKASESTGKPVPEIIPLSLGQVVELEGLKVTALPANHTSNYSDEQALIYLIEKDSTRLLYATDTAGLMALALAMAGVGQFSRERKFLTGIIMEATMGLDYENNDQRMFSHSSVAQVANTVKVLSDSRKYVPVEGQKVYITHMSKVQQPAQEVLDRTLPDPITAAYDGLEVVFP
jgi:ribonuclease BN (tRNA processing enzyme)